MDTSGSWESGDRGGVCVCIYICVCVCVEGGEQGEQEGRRREDRGSLVEFTHHITAANRNPQSISDIFIIPVKFY